MAGEGAIAGTLRPGSARGKRGGDRDAGVAARRTNFPEKGRANAGLTTRSRTVAFDMETGPGTTPGSAHPEATAMLKLRDIMTRDLVTFAPDLTLREAADTLLERHLSAAPVVAGDRLLGVISTPDILGFVASAPPAPDPAVEERDWAAEVEEAAEREELEEEESESYFAELWPGSDDELVERFGTTRERAAQDPLDTYTVAEAMTRGARTLPPEAGVDEAAEMMRREGIHRVLVSSDGRLHGIVSALDIAKAVAEHRLLVRRYVFDRGRR